MKKGRRRRDDEQPAATERWGWRFHHLGIPTSDRRPGEQYLAEYKLHVSGFETSPYGIEWMRYDPGSPISPLVQTVPHVAFEVDDLEEAIVGKELLGEPTSPAPGIRVAMIVDDGAPVELIEFAKPARKDRRKRRPRP